jgi:hypothetical protein
MTSRYKPQLFCCWSQYEVEGFANGWHKAVSTNLLRGRSMGRTVGSMAEVDGHRSDLRNLAATTDMPQVGCVLSSTFSFRFYRDTFV